MREIIQTGLTKNYVAYWSERQALKEAAQNICYGGVKSEIKPLLYYKNGYGYMKDFYSGFEKRYLYLGESKQRDDEEKGLGNFGEGWKMFLLVMARNGRDHLIETVGYSFYGKMMETKHGVEVLNIIIEPNERHEGTQVKVECNEEDFWAAVEAFAFLQGIEVEDNGVIKNRQGELWINGVRIETDDSKNPADLYFAYSLRGKDLTNRDRTQINQDAVLRLLSQVIYMADEDFIKEYLQKALDDPENLDFNRPPAFYLYDKEAHERWIKEIMRLHKVKKQEQLLISSGRIKIDNEAAYRGYKIIQLPRKWNWQLEALGFREASKVISSKIHKTEIELTEEMAKMLKRAKLDTKKALRLKTVKSLPKIKVVEKIENLDQVFEAVGLYERDTKTIYLSLAAFKSQKDLTLTLIHEAIHWETGADDNCAEFTFGFEKAIGNLLNY